MAKLACLHCDLLLNSVDIRRGQRAVCPRCKQVIYLDQQSFNTSLALLITALLLYFPAILSPFLQMEVSGQTHQVSLFSSIATIAAGDTLLLAVTVFMLVLVFPLIKFLGLLSIMLPLALQRLPFFGVGMTRFILQSAPWSMVEVYLVGVLVTLVKLAAMATIDFSVGFYTFVALILINAAISMVLPRKRIWQHIAAIKQRQHLSRSVSGHVTTANNAAVKS